MSTIYSKSYHLKGLEIIDGKLKLNDGIIEGVSTLSIGNWTLELNEDGGELLIKNDDVIHAKISNDNLSYNEDLRYGRFFMTEAINIEESKGLLVSNIGCFYNYDLTQNPSENYSQSMIKLSNVRKDPKVMGVIIDCEKYNREYTQGAFKTVCSQDDEVNRVFVNNKGSGVVWVCDRNGPLKNGDYITSCEIPGYGMRQDDDVCHNYTFGKITHDCNFNPKTIILQKPVDFDEDGPIYEPICNYDGEEITDMEYKVKFIFADGTRAKRKDYDKEVNRLLKSGVKEKELLYSSARNVFKCSLVGYYI